MSALVSVRVAAIVGPTAVGKSAVAVDVARRLGAEIVSIDSMQVYRGMDIGTDKATQDMRAAVPHHLLDLRPPSHALTAAEFQSLARAAIDDIATRGRLPLLVGGSGLYFRAVVDDLRFPPRSTTTRTDLEGKVARLGPEALHRRLTRIDPEAASRIDRGNARRLVRAFEVIEETGRPFSQGTAWDRYESVYELHVAGLTRARADLYRRVAARVDRMLESGLVDEVRRLDAKGMGPTARQALGYRQVLEAPAGIALTDLRSAIVAATKRYVRRQDSWFRADPRVVWFDAGATDVVTRLVEHLG